MTSPLVRSIGRSLPGPILVVGASGFVGANLLIQLLEVRNDVYGTFLGSAPWRLRDLPAIQQLRMDLQNVDEVRSVLNGLHPRTIFYCAAYGAYSFQTDATKTLRINLECLQRFVDEMATLGDVTLIHAGSSSEYGMNCAGPAEDAPRRPNSSYAISKSAAADLIANMGQNQDIRCANLRLYSVYGPFEDTSRLIATLCLKGAAGELPPLAAPQTSRDYIHVDDVVAAFVVAASNLPRSHWGESFNIGTGRKTTIAEIADLAQSTFSITAAPQFGQLTRSWDLPDWYAQTDKSEKVLGWKAQVSIEEGLSKTARWWKTYTVGGVDPELLSEKNRARRDKTSLSAVIACYKDAQAIPQMYERLTRTLSAAGLDYEIIFVNDGSPDDSAEVIRRITSEDTRVLGITHSRNFGSQAAFRSGMEISTREACVLLDGDLQDPPEIIAAFVEKWREGYEVVYGRRVRREMPRAREFMYKSFYRLFEALSSIPIPRDAGDFSLMDANAMRWVLACSEKDSFVRGLRAYVGFRQTGVDYERPERPFGRSTNNLLANFNWAKMAILSFSTAPLSFFTLSGLVLVGTTALLAFFMILTRLFAPWMTPPGVTTLLLAVMFFGSFSVMGIAIVGEYVGKILTEAKARPSFIRRHIITGGRIEPAGLTNRGTTNAP